MTSAGRAGKMEPIGSIFKAPCAPSAPSAPTAQGHTKAGDAWMSAAPVCPVCPSAYIGSAMIGAPDDIGRRTGPFLLSPHLPRLPRVPGQTILGAPCK